ncbi:MAG: hypothetical protein RJA44_1106 [Pseudomonadota bacterium]|jgi:hypothetical protein
MRRIAPVRRLLGAALLLALVGCAQAPKPLYMWEGFPRQQYETLSHEGGSSAEQQAQALEAQAEKARGAGAALPPGFRAHLGMLYLSMGNASAAAQMWTAEKGAFPEGAPYMDYLLKRLDATVQATNGGK